MPTVETTTIAQLSAGQDWRLRLVHDRDHHLLIWITRGQGVGILHGTRRGLGPHNAIFVPAGFLMSLDVGRQVIGQAVMISPDTAGQWPEEPQHLRIRDVRDQATLTAQLEGMAQEASGQLHFHADALAAQALLLSVWLQRQIEREPAAPKPNAAARLSQKFCMNISARYQSGAPMADYAKALGVTPTHLTRALKASTGKTAADLLTERCLHAARTQLLDTQQSAKDIAAGLGFRSAGYFTRFVQHHTGKTPSDLRARPAR